MDTEKSKGHKVIWEKENTKSRRWSLGEITFSS